MWEALKRIAFVGLAAYFVYIVAKSAKKLSAHRVASTTQMAYSANIMFPAMTACMMTLDGFADGKMHGGSLSLLSEPVNVSSLLIALSYGEINSREEIWRVNVGESNFSDNANIIYGHYALFPEAFVAANRSVVRCVTFDPPSQSGMGYISRVNLLLNVSEYNVVQLFLHNKNQHFIPPLESTFGSASTYVYFKKRIQDADRTLFYSQEFALDRTEWTKIDHPHDRCSDNEDNPNLLPCISKYIESKLGCGHPTLKGGTTLARHCNTHEEHLAYLNLSHPFVYGSEAAIFKRSGCLPPCKITEYSVAPKSELQRSEPREPFEPSNSLLLQLWFPSGRYKQREQYLVYDVSSLIADIGGYLGLLLGHSIYSIVCSLDGLCTNLRAPITLKVQAIK